MNVRSRVAVVLLGTLALACPEVVRTRTSFSPAPPGDPPRIIAIKDGVRVLGKAGDGQRIPSGSTWKLVGAVGEGDVYRRADGPFIESQNAHEAYLVVTNDQVVGFYLPGEGAFAPLLQPVGLPPQ